MRPSTLDQQLHSLLRKMSGARSFDVYRGSRYQRGHGQKGYGLGGIFKSLARVLRPALLSAGKAAMSVGGEMLNDVGKGDSVRQAFRKRIINPVLGEQKGGSRKRRKMSNKKNVKNKKSRVVKKRKKQSTLKKQRANKNKRKTKKQINSRGRSKRKHNSQKLRAQQRRQLQGIFGPI